ncbi:MAG: PAS domain S-box protein [Betaproteobacteria bacterium]|nr:PAS domain S-box protein [Betaproteobacteria bacterium]
MFNDAIGRSAAIIDSDFIALVLVKDRQIVWANRAMHCIFGYEPDELIGMPTRGLFLDEASYQDFGRESLAVIAQGRTFRFEIELRRKDETTGWFAVNASALVGDPSTAVVAILDVSEQKAAELALKSSEARYRAVVQDQTEVICRVLPDSTFLFVNDVYCRLYGKSADEVIGRRWQPGAHPDDLPLIEARLHTMSAENPVVINENRAILAGGEIRWMQFVNRGTFDAAGNLLEIQAVGRDITPLVDARERLEMALSGSGLVLWDWEIPAHKLTFGKGWQALLGYVEPAVATDADDWTRLIHAKDRDRFERAISAHLSGETADFEGEARFRHKDGHWLTIEARGRVTLRDAGGLPLRMLGTALDVTQRKRLGNEGVTLLKQIESLIREASAGVTAGRGEGKALQCLTKRERQVLGLIADGMTSAQIAAQLKLATNTVINHRQNMMAKLDLHNTAEITRFAIDHGLVEH